MAITVNGAVLRNMPEQISKNVEDIADLQTTSENHETRIAALEAGAIALATFQDCTFTGTSEFQGNINQTSGNLSVTNDATVGGTFNANGASYLSATSVTGNLAVTGAITGGSIIENMSGYSFAFSYTDAALTIENIYCSCCKNGNKITFVWFLKATMTSSITSSYAGVFTIPSSIANKLYPTNYNYLYFGRTQAVDTSLNYVDLKYGIEKVSGSNYVGLVLRGLSSALTENEQYTIRIESTFLLSDDMGS